MLSAAWVLSIATFATQFVHPLVQADAARVAAAVTPAPDVYTMRADGTGQTRVTVDPRDLHFGPAWSPDGRTIVYMCTRARSTPAWAAAHSGPCGRTGAGSGS